MLQTRIAFVAMVAIVSLPLIHPSHASGATRVIVPQGANYRAWDGTAAAVGEIARKTVPPGKGVNVRVQLPQAPARAGDTPYKTIRFAARITYHRPSDNSITHTGTASVRQDPLRRGGYQLVITRLRISKLRNP
jgi:hypothetical protein